MDSLRSISDCLFRAKVSGHCIKLPRNTIELIRSSDNDSTNHWFCTTVRRGIYVVQLKGVDVQPQAIVIDASRRLVHDCAQPEVLRLSFEVLKLLTKSNGKEMRISSARRSAGLVKRIRERERFHGFNLFQMRMIDHVRPYYLTNLSYIDF